MSSSKEIFARHYDRILAVFVLVALLFSLLYLVLKGMDVQQSLNDNKGTFVPPTELSKRASKKLTDEVARLKDKMTAAQAVAQNIKVAVPKDRADENEPQPANLFTSDPRYLCEVCRLPIKIDAKKCTYAKCGKEQTLLAKNEKLDLKNVDADTDGDGMMDKWEVQYGFNPNAPEDADLDADDDGFSNIEEYEAKTNPKDASSHLDYKDYIALTHLEKQFLRLRAVKEGLGGTATDADGKLINLTAIDFVEVDEEGNVKRTYVRQMPGTRIGATRYRYQTYTKASSVLEYQTSVAGATSKQTAKKPVNTSTIVVTIMGEKAIKAYTDYMEKKTAREEAEKQAAIGRLDKAEVEKLRKEEEKAKARDGQYAKKERETKGAAYTLTFYDETFYKIPGTTWAGEPLIGLSADVTVNLLPEPLEFKGLTKGKTVKIKQEEYVVSNLDEAKETLTLKPKKGGKAFTLSKK